MLIKRWVWFPDFLNIYRVPVFLFAENINGIIIKLLNIFIHFKIGFYFLVPHSEFGGITLSFSLFCRHWRTVPMLLSTERQEKRRAQVPAFSFSTAKPQNGSVLPAKWHITKEEGVFVIGETLWFSFSGFSLLFRDQVLPVFNTDNVLKDNKVLKWNVSELLCHCLNAQSKVYEIHQGNWGEEKKSREFLWMYYEKSVFYSSHEKGRKGLCETHFSSLEHTLNNFTSELSVDYFSECYRMKETCTGNSSRNTGPFMFLS